MSGVESDATAKENLCERVRRYVGELERASQPGQVPRARSKRYPFQRVQRLAPYRGGVLPDEAQFTAVRCRDISTSGLSFFWPQAPDYEDVVVKLGDNEAAICLVAHVVRAEPVDGDFRCTHVVACKFTGRLSP